MPSRQPIPLSNPALLFRQELLSRGYTPSAIRHQLSVGTWARIFEGVCLVTSAEQEIRRNAVQLAWLHRAGRDAAFSHHTAAAHHGFDSTYGWRSSPITLTHSIQHRLPEVAGYRFVRSRTLEIQQTISSNGLSFTSRIRTLLDVLATLDLVEGERVLESALRGPDPKRPDVWRTDDLAQLCQFITDHPRQPGVRQARLLLAQRPAGSRPTGSIAATAVLQALRGAGFPDIVREPLVIAPDEHGNPRRHFIDLFLERGLCDIEVDGNTHFEPRRRAEDLKRDRRLSKAMGVVRFTAHEALNEPDRVVEVVREAIARRAHDLRVGTPSHHLVGEGLCWEIIPRVKVA
jgi:hypothetical protein